MILELTGRIRIKYSYVGEPLVKFWLFSSVSGTDTTHTKEIKYKKSSVGEPLANFWLFTSVGETD